jgi:tetratricopeptide (TPR) repeat protein
MAHRFLTSLLLISSCTWAQFSSQNTGNVKVRVIFTDGRSCDIQVRVQLKGNAGTSNVGEAFTNDNGQTEFSRVVPGNYHVLASGQGIEPADSGIFEVDNRKVSQSVDVTVRRVGEVDIEMAKKGTNATVSAADLHIPSAARKEFEKAISQMTKKKWNNAVAGFNRALAIYPSYAAAYNNLGVVYAKLGNRDAERDALQKAVALDDHLAPAYMNLGIMAIADRNFPAAEGFLNKATASDPENPQTLVLLANTELLDRHYDEAISNCHKVHAMPHGSQTLVHYIAARALEHENRPADAVTEFQTFLKEEPSGPRAQAVREELARIQRQIQ